MMEILEPAQKLVFLIEDPSINLPVFAREAVICLSTLFTSMIMLNPVPVNSEWKEPTIENEEMVMSNMLRLFNGNKEYNQVYDPTEDHEYVTFSLVNDLCEIHQGLKVFLIKQNLNHSLAIWDFSEDFRSHLYQHVLNAMKVLYMEYCKDI